MLSVTDRLLLQAVQGRKNLGLKGVLQEEDLSYRQSLRHISDLVEKHIIQAWVPLLHPQTLGYRKHMWFWLRTNPQKPEELLFFKRMKPFF